MNVTDRVVDGLAVLGCNLDPVALVRLVEVNDTLGNRLVEFGLEQQTVAGEL